MAKLAADLPELIVARKKGSREAANAHKGWQLVSAFTSPHVCGDGESYATDFRLPESITGPTFRADVLRRLLKSIRKQGIHAGEYLLTPDAGLLVAVGTFRLMKQSRSLR